MRFGVKEMKEFAENHEDERVRKLYQRLAEARSKNAQWCAEVARLNMLVDQLKGAGAAKQWQLRD